MSETYSNGWKTEKTSASVLTVRFEDVSAGWEQWIMLSSDRHHDSINCNRELEKKHLNQAVEKQAMIIDCGDLFDCMQGRFDPRRSYAELRPEYKADNYLDEIVTDASKFYAPYAKNFAVISRGNHDLMVRKNNSTDLISNLVYRLNSDNKTDIVPGEIGGWVRFMFVIGTIKTSIKLNYFHGAGGGGPVTRGVIQTNRQAVYMPDADIIVNGHTHDAWVVPIARVRLSNKGVIGKDYLYFVRTPTYGDDYGDGTGGWWVERWGAPKPLGCVWLRLYYHSNRIKFEAFPDLE